MHSMQDLFFLARWVEMVYYVPNVLISVTEKKHNFQNNENIALLHLKIKKRQILSELAQVFCGLLSLMSILLSKNEMHRYHADCCLFRSRCLVSSHTIVIHFFPVTALE